MAVTCYIGFGSNVGDLSKNWQEAKNMLNCIEHTQINRVSPLYLTEPLTQNEHKQTWYLNCVLEIQTTLSLHALFEKLQLIEKKMGREKRERWAPRPADLDILFYDNLIYADKQIQVPHHGIHLRKFVLQPLCDLSPDLIHPELQMSIKDILADSEDALTIKPFEECHA